MKCTLPQSSSRVALPSTEKKLTEQRLEQVRGWRSSCDSDFVAMEEPPRLPRSFTLIPKPPTEPTLDPSLLVPAQMTYRSTGLGFYAIAVRCCTMPLEKLAMIMNSAQVRH